MSLRILYYDLSKLVVAYWPKFFTNPLHWHRLSIQSHPFPLLNEKGCALQHCVSCLHKRAKAKEHEVKIVHCPLMGQSFSHLKHHPSVSLLLVYKASTSTLYIFCNFALIFFHLTDLSHTQDKAWTDLSLHMFATYLLMHAQLSLCKEINFCLLHAADSELGCRSDDWWNNPATSAGACKLCNTSVTYFSQHLHVSYQQGFSEVSGCLQGSEGWSHCTKPRPEGWSSTQLWAHAKISLMLMTTHKTFQILFPLQKRGNHWDKEETKPNDQLKKEKNIRRKKEKQKNNSKKNWKGDIIPHFVRNPTVFTSRFLPLFFKQWSDTLSLESLCGQNTTQTVCSFCPLQMP